MAALARFSAAPSDKCEQLLRYHAHPDLELQILRKILVALAISSAHPSVLASQSLAWPDLSSHVERNNSAFLTQVNATTAVDAGMRGRGVTVAVLDTGVGGLHPEFAGRLLSGFDATTGTIIASPLLVDVDGHGTHVAGIIGAARDGKGMHGIAPEAHLLSVRVFDDAGIATSSSLGKGLRYVNDSPAFVLNLSLGAPRPMDAHVEAALLGNIQDGKLVVVAAGNGGARNPTWPARYAKEPSALNQIIVVGAVDSENVLTSFSNRAGDTAAWYIVAPGVDLMSSYGDSTNTYAYMSGTSVATPAVSGAAALLKSEWPTLTAGQTAEILFRTATDLGAPGVDPIYGWGLLNVEKAMQPFGGLNIVTHAGAIPLHHAQAKLSPAAAGAALRLQHVSLSGFDHFGRDYKTNTALVRSGTGDFDARTPQTMATVLDGHRVRLVDGKIFFAQPDLTKSAYPTGGAYFARRFSATPIEITFSTGALAGAWHGLAGSPFPGTGATAFAVSDNPYFGFAHATMHTGIGLDLAGDWKAKVGFLTGDARGSVAADSNVSIAEISKSIGPDLWVSVQASRLHEQGMLGTSLKHGKQQSVSTVTTFRAAHAWSDGITSFLTYSQAKNRMPQTGVFHEVQSKSDAWSAGLIAEHIWREDDRLLFELSTPVAVTDGTLTAEWVSGFDGDGSERIERHTASMKPKHRELRLATAYNYRVARNTRLSFGFHWRHHADNTSDTARVGGFISWRGEF